MVYIFFNIYDAFLLLYSFFFLNWLYSCWTFSAADPAGAFAYNYTKDTDNPINLVMSNQFLVCFLLFKKYI